MKTIEIIKKQVAYISVNGNMYETLNECYAADISQLLTYNNVSLCSLKAWFVTNVEPIHYTKYSIYNEIIDMSYDEFVSYILKFGFKNTSTANYLHLIFDILDLEYKSDMAIFDQNLKRDTFLELLIKYEHKFLSDISLNPTLKDLLNKKIQQWIDENKFEKINLYKNYLLKGDFIVYFAKKVNIAKNIDGFVYNETKNICIRRDDIATMYNLKYINDITFYDMCQLFKHNYEYKTHDRFNKFDDITVSEKRIEIKRDNLLVHIKYDSTNFLEVFNNLETLIQEFVTDYKRYIELNAELYELRQKHDFRY